jgi:inhibitor of KinA
MTDLPPRYSPLGDSAVTIKLGDVISRELSARVFHVADALGAAALDGVVDIVPSYACIGVFYDPIRVKFAELLSQLRPIVDQTRKSASGEFESMRGRVIRIPVVYDGADLGEVAARSGYSKDEVVRLHAEREYHVYVIGFVPGFAYLGELHPALVLPRRATPRAHVPGGSVAIAEAQTGVYPFSTPGGWHLIGTTNAKMFDAAARNPALLRVGDRVVFEPVAK